MKVTSLEKQKKNLKRFNVFIDGQFAFGADEDLIVNYRLLPGKELSPTDLEKLTYEAQVGKLMEKIYRLFSIRMRSEAEIRQYFKAKNYELKLKEEEPISDLAVDQLIERAKKKDLINDEVFAALWVEARRKSKKLGERALRMELVKKGIDKDTIEKVLNNEQLTTDYEQLAKEALEKKLRLWKSLEPLEFKKKATDYLLRKGFDYGLVRGLVEKIIKKSYNT